MRWAIDECVVMLADGCSSCRTCRWLNSCSDLSHLSKKNVFLLRWQSQQIPVRAASFERDTNFCESRALVRMCRCEVQHSSEIAYAASVESAINQHGGRGEVPINNECVSCNNKDTERTLLKAMSDETVSITVSVKGGGYQQWKHRFSWRRRRWATTMMMMVNYCCVIHSFIHSFIL